jgi:hypothetical protein
MKKHPQIKVNAIEGSCNYSNQLLLKNIKVSNYAFNKYINKANYIYSPTSLIKAFKLPCGCYLWKHINGNKELSLLPF